MYGSKEIAEILGIKPVTVRKYAAALEDAGYIISRSDSGHRTYSEVDATVFRELQVLCERSGMTVENSAKVVASRHIGASATVAPAVVQQQTALMERYEERYTEMMGVIESLREQNECLNKRLDEQNNNISVILREVLNTKKMMIENNRRKWWKFWDKRDPMIGEPDPEQVWKEKQERLM